MPAFASIPPPALYAGDSYQLVNVADATAGNITYTQAVVGVQSAQVAGNQWTLQNTTNETATVYVAAQDAATSAHPNGQTANYSALTDADSAEAITAAASSTINFTTAGPFVCCHFGTSPSSGLLIIAR